MEYSAGNSLVERLAHDREMCGGRPGILALDGRANLLGERADARLHVLVPGVALEALAVGV